MLFKWQRPVSCYYKSIFLTCTCPASQSGTRIGSPNGVFFCYGLGHVSRLLICLKWCFQIWETRTTFTAVDSVNGREKVMNRCEWLFTNHSWQLQQIMINGVVFFRRSVKIFGTHSLEKFSFETGLCNAFLHSVGLTHLWDPCVGDCPER